MGCIDCETCANNIPDATCLKKEEYEHMFENLSNMDHNAFAEFAQARCKYYERREEGAV